MSQRDPMSTGAQDGGAGEDTQLPKVGAAWVRPASGGLAAGPGLLGGARYGETPGQGLPGGMVGRTAGQGLVGSPGQAGAAAWPSMCDFVDGRPGGGFDGTPGQLVERPAPVTVGISPEYLGLVTAAGTTIAAMGTVYSSVLATFKDRRERQANDREQEKHALAMKKLKLEIAQAAASLSKSQQVGEVPVPRSKKKG